jgi:hypothetical protein
MFYFFERGSAYVRCEVRHVSGSNACEIVITEQGAAERIETYLSWEAAQERWEELTHHFTAEGWKGPIGRE